jgi:hypothetical protein
MAAAGDGLTALSRARGALGATLAAEATVALLRLALLLALAALYGRAVADALLHSSEPSLAGVFGDGLAALLDPQRLWVAALGLALLEALGASVRVLWVGGAAVQMADFLKDREKPPEDLMTAAARALPRAVPASLLLWVAEWAAGLLRWTLLLGALWMGAQAVRQPSLGAALGAAFGAGLWAVLVAVVPQAARVAWVRAVRSGDGVASALGEAAALFADRLGTYLGLWLVQVVFAFGAGMLTGAFSVGGLVAQDAPLLGIAIRAVGAVLSAGLGVAIELSLLGAVVALDLDAHGELPPPPPPPRPPPPEEPIYVAQEVPPPLHPSVPEGTTVH